MLELIKNKKFGTVYYGWCPSHPINALRFSCWTCKVEICEDCVAKHSGHEFEKLKYS